MCRCASNINAIAADWPLSAIFSRHCTDMSWCCMCAMSVHAQMCHIKAVTLHLQCRTPWPSASSLVLEDVICHCSTDQLGKCTYLAMQTSVREFYSLQIQRHWCFVWLLAGLVFDTALLRLSAPVNSFFITSGCLTVLAWTLSHRHTLRSVCWKLVESVLMKAGRATALLWW